jgi:hypothetical protein
MKIENHLNFRNIFPALLAAVLFCGCAASGSKQSAATADTQTAGTRQVIVLPVLILSSPDEKSPGNRREPAPDTSPLNQSTQGWASPQTGPPVKL